MILSNTEPLKMVMYETIKMPERKFINKQWIPTGNQQVFTGYTFRDDFGNKFYCISSKPDFIKFEGQTVKVYFQMAYDDYKKKLRLTLDFVESVKK